MSVNVGNVYPSQPVMVHIKRRLNVGRLQRLHPLTDPALEDHRGQQRETAKSAIGRQAGEERQNPDNDPYGWGKGLPPPLTQHQTPGRWLRLLCSTRGTKYQAGTVGIRTERNVRRTTEFNNKTVGEGYGITRDGMRAPQGPDQDAAGAAAACTPGNHGANP